MFSAIPAWLAKKYPDILSDTHSGRCRYGARQNFDLTHPGYRFHAERSAGAQGVSYWHWHSIHNAIESYWKGVLSHDFSEGAVYREAATIGSDFQRLSEKLIHLKKHNRVAIMVSNRSQTGMKWFPTDGKLITIFKSFFADPVQKI